MRKMNDFISSDQTTANSLYYLVWTDTKLESDFVDRKKYINTKSYEWLKISQES